MGVVSSATNSNVPLETGAVPALTALHGRLRKKPLAAEWDLSMADLKNRWVRVIPAV